jgi:hypothetical protein
MLRLEGFMEIQKLHADGLSVSEISRRLNLDRKTVRKYLRETPRAYETEAEGLEGGWFPVVFAGAMGTWSSQRLPVVPGDPQA